MMNRRPHFFAHTPLVGAVDLILIHVSFLVAFFVRAGGDGIHSSDFHTYWNVLPWLCVSALVIISVCDLYTNWLRHSRSEIFYLLLVSVALLAVGEMTISLWRDQFSIPSSVILGAAVVQIALLTSYRLWICSMHRPVHSNTRVLMIAADAESAIASQEHLANCIPAWMDISEYLLTEDLSKLEERLEQFSAALLLSGVAHQPSIMRVCARMGKTVLVVPGVQELSILGANPYELGDALVLSVQPPRLTPGQALLKRVVDLMGAASLLLVSAPVLAIVAVLVRISSNGPAIFRQDRVGKDGVEYTLYKFRTMVADAERATGPVLASKTDARITRLGAFLRSTRLDELPQLFNVLRGEMSLVGPRPERDFFVSQFRESVTGYDFRHSVKPGVTGLAQVFGRYSTTVERKLRFDLMYIYNYSLVLDIQILLRTVLVVLHAERAAGVANTTAPINAAMQTELTSQMQ
jgi:exopolysaccharide biosynthesis polyprenyl glycosylphosphotransferase